MVVAAEAVGVRQPESLDEQLSDEQLDAWLPEGLDLSHIVSEGVLSAKQLRRLKEWL